MTKISKGSFIGIDISKHDLQGYLLPDKKGRTFLNTPQGIKNCLAWIGTNDQICSDKDISILKGNVRSDHIHLFVEAPAHLSVSKIAQYLKGISSFRLMQDYPHLKKRYWSSHLWSRGYFCSTAGSMTGEAVKSYIENQDDVPKDFQVWDEERKDLSS